jgi:dTDP-4-dehydrorhamnose 3,5-epimerase
MKIKSTDIPGLLIIEPEVYQDERGYFFEAYNKQKFLDCGIDVDFIQDNESYSKKGVLRGLHYQKEPYSQGKLVRVVKGSVLDVAVDIRAGSPTFGKWSAVELSSENKLMYWIPKGFAHGFLTLEDDTIFTYKCSGIYHRPSEAAIYWNDPTLAINWGITEPILSEKDKLAPFLKELETQ